MKKTAAAVVMGLVLALGACSPQDAPKDEPKVAAVEEEMPVEHEYEEPVFFDESTVREHIGMKGDYVYLADGTECEIAVVLTSANDVALYADAGDVVATNADRTAGVKIVAPESVTCKKGIDELMSGL